MKLTRTMHATHTHNLHSVIINSLFHILWNHISFQMVFHLKKKSFFSITHAHSLSHISRTSCFSTITKAFSNNCHYRIHTHIHTIIDMILWFGILWYVTFIRNTHTHSEAIRQFSAEYSDTNSCFIQFLWSGMGV